jgi:hypothetical protein
MLMGFKQRAWPLRSIAIHVLSRAIHVLLLAISLAKPAISAEYTQDLNEFINLEIKPWVNSDIVIDNLNKQNENNFNLSESSLRVLDSNWRSEFRKVNQPLIGQVISNELSQFLQKKIIEGRGVYTELTIINNKALNIAQTVVSEGYWNLGQPRWDKTFAEKSYTPYISDIYYSDETSKFQLEVSFMIIAEDQPVGVVVAGIDVEQLEDWKRRRK